MRTTLNSMKSMPCHPHSKIDKRRIGLKEIKFWNHYKGGCRTLMELKAAACRSYRGIKRKFMDSTDLGAQVKTNLIVSDMDFELPMCCTEGDTKTKLMKGLSFTFVFQSQSASFLAGFVNNSTSSKTCRCFWNGWGIQSVGSTEAINLGCNFFLCMAFACIRQKLSKR